MNLKISKPFLGLFNDKCRIKDLWGGRGRGGSYTGTAYLVYLMLTSTYFRGFLVRRIFSDIRMSLFQDMKDRLMENADINMEDFKINDVRLEIVHRPTGNMISSKGIVSDGGRTARAKSLAGGTHALIEEAEELSEIDFDTLSMSLRTTKANPEIIRIFNPPPINHWIWRDYDLIPHSEINGQLYYTAKSINPNVHSYFATYMDNIRNIDALTMKDMEAYKDKNKFYYYNQICGLIPSVSGGVVYSNWEKVSEEFFKNLYSPIYFGIDFGFGHAPTAIVKVKKDGNKRYFKEIAYKLNMTNLDIIHALKENGYTADVRTVADSGSGNSMCIRELNAGIYNQDTGETESISVLPAKKLGGSVNEGVRRLQSMQCFYTDESNNIEYELNTYIWKPLKVLENDISPLPKNDHLMDAIRYVENIIALGY